MSIWPWRKKEEELNLEKERTYKLLILSTRVCRHCEHFQKYSCTLGPNEDDPDWKTFPWSSMSACDDWEPNAVADEALQVLTMRKLEGEEIDWIDPEQKRRARKRQEMINRLGYDPDDV